MPKKFAELRDELKKTLTEAQAIAAKAEAEGRDFTDDEVRQVDELLARSKTLKADAERAKAFETMHAQLAGVGGPVEPGSGGRKTDVHPKVKAAGGSDWSEVALKRLTGPDGYKGVIEPGAVLVSVPLDPEPVRMDVPVLSLRQLLPSVPNTTDRFSYIRQTLRTNNAAVVAKGEKKPTSLYRTNTVEGRTSTIAHLSEPIPRQDLADVALLQQFIEQEMRLGLEIALEDEIMNGDGTGEHFTGLANVSGIQVQAYTTDILVTARKAVTALERYGYLPRAGWLMSREDWETFELTRDAEQRFYFGGPVTAVDPSSRRLWGVPVVVSEAAPIGTAYLADFSQMRLHIREEGRLDWSENVYDPDALGTGVGASDWERNMIRFRYEGRFGLEVRRPSAIVEVDLTAA
ncbi:phage major capsid protein [Streptomyces mangrovi]|uniref:phage major capsid protein n=1 Tax=Streptomyces mangrovi TaxID=1206892 RepID=UPI00399D2858